MRKIRKGDTVYVIAGKDKGKTGPIQAVVKKGEYVLVEGINMVTKHIKDNPQLGIEAGIKKIEKPIHISNVALYNQSTQKPDRVQIRILEDGKKVRIFKSTQEKVDV